MKTRAIQLISAVLFLSSAGIPVVAAPWQYDGAATAAMMAYEMKYKVPNVAVAVSKNGQIIYAKGFKWAGFPVPQNNGDDWVFRLASCSKPITAIMAMELVQQGKLDLSKPIRHYVPFLLPTHAYTVGDLMAHLAGVRHYRDGSDPTKDVDKNYKTAASAIMLFFLDPLVGHPREKYFYSTHGFTVLAAAIEKVTGKSIASHALSRFGSWGLMSLKPEMPGIPWPTRVPIYDEDNDKTDRDNLSWKYAGGGYEASVRDLCKLSDKLMKGQIINSTMLNQMWTSKTTKAGQSTGYGYGWSVGNESGRKVRSHSGSQRGSNSYWKVYPDDGVTVVVLTNRQGTQPGKLADYFSKLAFATGTAPKPDF